MERGLAKRTAVPARPGRSWTASLGRLTQADEQQALGRAGPVGRVQQQGLVGGGLEFAGGQDRLGGGKSAADSVVSKDRARVWRVLASGGGLVGGEYTHKQFGLDPGGAAKFQFGFHVPLLAVLQLALFYRLSGQRGCARCACSL